MDTTTDTQTTPGFDDLPAHVPPELVHMLDHWNGPDYLADPIGFWDDLRDRYRVFWSPAHGGFWCLTRYEDVHAAYQNAELFSSNPQNIPARDAHLIPTSLDPPEHTKYRRLLNEPFAPARVERLSVRIIEVCNELLDHLAAQATCDFVADFAQALPTQIFLELMGLPADQIEKFMGWNYTILHVNGVDGIERQRQANEEVQAYLAEIVAFRRNHGGDDLVSFLLPLPIDGRTLTD
jgi:cytochrome P450